MVSNRSMSSSFRETLYTANANSWSLEASESWSSEALKIKVTISCDQLKWNNKLKDG